MSVLIVPAVDVRGLLPMSDCMDAMAAVLETLARGDAILPLRPVLWLPERRGALGMMPAYLGDAGVMGLKAVSVFPGNEGTGYDSHQGAVLVFETGNGRLLAIVDASEITAVRTAATSGVATRALARADAGDLAILGAGTQARTHLAAMLVARPIRRARVWSRTAANAARFAERESAVHGVTVEVAQTARDAVDGADVICTTTAAREPVLLGEWIAPGAHVNAVGSSVPFARELDGPAMARARLFADRRESVLAESGDFLLAREEGAIGDAHIAGELGEVLLGEIEGRTGPDEITVFESLGLAVEDLAAAFLVYERALARGAGTSLELGGLRADA